MYRLIVRSVYINLLCSFWPYRYDQQKPYEITFYLDIKCKSNLFQPQAIDDEELKEILNTNEVPQNLNAVKMDNGRENKTSTRRLHTLKVQRSN